MSDQVQGVFLSTLTRNNKQIRDDRAQSISEAAEMMYRRAVENLQFKINQLKRQRDNMLDLSPTTADSLTLVNDFDGEKFAADDIALGVQIRNEEIKLEIAKDRYQYLFGGEKPVE